MLGGEEVPCYLTQVVSDTLRGTSTFGKTITTFYEFVQLDNGEPNILQTHFPTTLLLWGTN
jgi:hypothetical protein